MSPGERTRIRRNIADTVAACGIAPKSREGQDIVDRYDTLMRVTFTSMLTERLKRIRALRHAWRAAGARRAGVPRPRATIDLATGSAIDG
jgi:hypothetical protein